MRRFFAASSLKVHSIFMMAVIERPSVTMRGPVIIIMIIFSDSSVSIALGRQVSSLRLGLLSSQFPAWLTTFVRSRWKMVSSTIIP